MERLHLICFVVTFVYCVSGNKQTPLSLTNERLTWAESKSKCNLKFAGQSALCENSSSTICNVALKKGDIESGGDFTAWIDGYVTRSSFMNSLGCHNVSVGNLHLPNITSLRIVNNDVSTCSLSCGYSLYYGLKGNTCFCINRTADVFFRTNKEHCGIKCGRNTEETCGGQTFTSSVLTVHSLVNNVLTQNCKVVPTSALVENATKLVFNGTNSYIRCYTVCGFKFKFALEGDSCYCLTDVILPLYDVDNGICNILCAGNQFERCGGSPFIPKYNFLSLYQALPGTGESLSAYGEDCAAVIRIDGDNYATVKRHCDEKNRFICDAIPTGREYVTTGASWRNARKYCEEQRDKLAVQFYYRNLELLRFYWIGYFRGASIIWGKDFPSPVQQSRFGIDCLALSRTADMYTLKVFDCNTELKALCGNGNDSSMDNYTHETSTFLLSTTLSSTAGTTKNGKESNTLASNSQNIWYTSAVAIGLTAGLLLALVVVCIVTAVCYKAKQKSRFKTLKSTASVKSFEFRKPSLRKKSVRINTQAVPTGRTIASNGMVTQELYDEIQYTGRRNTRITAASNSTYDDVIIGTNGACIYFDGKRKGEKDTITEGVSKKDTTVEPDAEYAIYQVLEEYGETRRNNNSKNKISDNPRKPGRNNPIENSGDKIEQSQVYHDLEEIPESAASEKSQKKTECNVTEETEYSFYHALEEAIGPSDNVSVHSLYHVLNGHNDTNNSTNALKYPMYDHIENGQK